MEPPDSSSNQATEKLFCGRIASVGVGSPKLTEIIQKFYQ